MLGWLKGLFKGKEAAPAEIISVGFLPVQEDPRMRMSVLRNAARKSDRAEKQAAFRSWQENNRQLDALYSRLAA